MPLFLISGEIVDVRFVFGQCLLHRQIDFDE